MQVKQVISMVVRVALVVIIGFLVIGMIQLFVQKDGVVYNFLKNTAGSVTEKSSELIESVLGENGLNDYGFYYGKKYYCDLGVGEFTVVFRDSGVYDLSACSIISVSYNDKTIVTDNGNHNVYDDGVRIIDSSLNEYVLDSSKLSSNISKNEYGFYFEVPYIGVDHPDNQVYTYYADGFYTLEEFHEEVYVCGSGSITTSLGELQILDDGKQLSSEYGFTLTLVE